MKKILFILGLSFLFFCPSVVDAASISVAGTTSTGTVGGNITVGVTISEASGLGSWEYSLDYDSSKLQLLSGNTHVVGYVDREGQTSQSYTYTFRVKGTGSTTISVVNTAIASWDEVVTSPTDSTTINLISRGEVEKNYSSDNNLASLEVEGYTLSPEFNKNTTNYKVEVDSDTTSVNVKATASDSKARVSGIGDIEVGEGANTINVVVEAENGSTKTYTIVVNVKEKDPINVKVDKEDLSVVRKSDELKDLVKDYYVETTVKINDEEVPAYKIEALDLTLVALKDDKGNIKFYTYDDGKYSLYQELSGGNLTIHLLDKGKYPANYKKYTVTIEGVEYTVYKLNKKSKYYLVYGENVETGKKGLYLYDSVDKSIQRYYTEEVESLNDELKINSYIIVGLTCLIVLLLIIFLIALHTKNSSKRKTKREIKKRLKQEKNDFLKD
ncbi:MAG TPA: cadherin-like beta sandwich domain-containing protein [Candidatus Onthousia excrementipullorum]|uniref:Cadherin-like beta sandwich domain-containing protein n=1 Tax=Candidatus Onthousia excrementipullorum TaxID=2840884 RepID=A0A9D1DT86_9FIRM|nr:cadherin-like beta sandwich domain-containing protein [Candidatus Onthousia excrementipullorum]